MTTTTIHVENDKVYKIRSGYGMNFVCCDCGLTHRMWIRPAGRGWIQWACLRDNRQTSARRRAEKLRRVAMALKRGL